MRGGAGRRLTYSISVTPDDGWRPGRYTAVFYEGAGVVGVAGWRRGSVMRCWGYNPVLGEVMLGNALELDKVDREILRTVCEMPLVSAGEVKEVMDRSISTVGRRLGLLEKWGFVDSTVMGAAFTAASRYRLMPKGAGCFYEPEVQFHLARRLNALCCFMPGLEWFYRLAPRLPLLTDLGEYWSFQWRFRDGIDALGQYEAGTVIFLWSGPWQSAAGFRQRLEEIIASGSGWPSLLCVVACDFWQAHVVNECLSDLGILDGTIVFCGETGRVSGSGRRRGGAVRLTPVPVLGAVSNVVRAGRPRMMSGVRVGRDSSHCHRILYMVEQFPGATVNGVRRSICTRHRYVSEKVSDMVEGDILLEVDGHHYLSNEGLMMAAHRDRVHAGRPARRFGLREDGLPAVARYRQHDGAAFMVVGVFREHGFPVAGGWRGDDYSGGDDAIAPDAMIFMGERSTGGGGWYYLEYERRASSVRHVVDKLRGYVARFSGGDRIPILLVARNVRMAEEFRRQAAEYDYPLWAVASRGLVYKRPETVVGQHTAWLGREGDKVALYPPGVSLLF